MLVRVNLENMYEVLDKLRLEKQQRLYNYWIKQSRRERGVGYVLGADVKGGVPRA